MLQSLLDENRKGKRLKVGAIPTKNIPKKSIETKPAKPARRALLRMFRNSDVPVIGKPVYKNLQQVTSRARKISLKEWSLDFQGNDIVFKTKNQNTLYAHTEVHISDGLEFSIWVFGWPLPVTHVIYKEYKRSIQHVTLSQLLNEINSYTLCEGVKNDDGRCRKHPILQNQPTTSGSADESDAGEEFNPFNTCRSYHRHPYCQVLVDEGNKCSQCQSCEKTIEASRKRRNAKLREPAKPNAPVSATHPMRLKLTLKDQRFKIQKLEEKIAEMQSEIKSASIGVTKDFSNDILNIISQKGKNMSPFMQLFWEQQKKAFSGSASGARYHPMIIRYCLAIHAKSPAAYNELRNSGILVLPSQRTLRDYKNAVKPKRGFNPEVIEELKQATQKLFDVQRYVCMTFDEMKIQAGLVFDKNSGELIGYTDLGDPDVNYSCLKQAEIASHVLVFYIRGLASDLKFPLANFATTGITSNQLVPIFWKAVAVLELKCNLWVVAVTSDGAAPNRRFYRIHFGISADTDTDFTYKVKNLFAPDRYIFFFADVPHLMKTSRNCLYHSGSNATRNMWNNGHYLIWKHIIDVYNKDLECGLHVLPKLTFDHIKLTSYSSMRVNLAVQILSGTMSKVLQLYGGPMCQETAKFCSFMDGFFDCCNVRSLTEGSRSRKPFCKPYTSINDERFIWLKQDFLGYLSTWKESTEKREGNFSRDERSRMFLSRQTYEGLQISVYSLVECCKFLLSKGFQYVLTERFCQDVVEEYFGRQRALGRRSDNPSLRNFGYNDNTLRIQRANTAVMGNTRGARKTKRAWYAVSNSPIKKRKL